jgi:hypothetical protein
MLLLLLMMMMMIIGSPYRGRRGAFKVFVRRPTGKNHLKDVGVDGRIILNWIFKKYTR